MGKNNIFLPVSQHDVEIAAMGTGVYRDTVTRGLPKATKTKSWVMKMFSAFTFLGLIFGGTIVGLSFKMIGDSQVGYYNSESGYMGPGTYFQFPWTKEEMKIVDIGVEFMRLERLVVVVANGQEFRIQNANVVYNVSNVDTYVKTLKKVTSPVYCQGDIENAVIDNISGTTPEDLPSLKELRDIPVPDCGITVERVVVSKPIVVTRQRCVSEEEETTKMPATTTTTTTTKMPATVGPDGLEVEDLLVGDGSGHGSIPGHGR